MGVGKLSLQFLMDRCLHDKLISSFSGSLSSEDKDRMGDGL